MTQHDEIKSIIEKAYKEYLNKDKNIIRSIVTHDQIKEPSGAGNWNAYEQKWED
jgi:hypothetical protein